VNLKKTMPNKIIQYLLENKQISAEEAEKTQQYEAQKPFSLHWELTSMLYLGVLLLNLGLGILIYENIDTIGHAFLIGAIGLLSTTCFYYTFRHHKPFSKEQVSSPTPYFDYVLLLGCLSFLIMEGYWQYQYQIFGERYGLATFVPMIFFFVLAYFFDHKGVLSLAITTLAAWVGLSITPLDLLKNNDFHSPSIIYSAIGLGIVLITIAYCTTVIGFKRHFSDIYHQFGIHILMVACLAGLTQLDNALVFSFLLILGTWYFIRYARQTDSLFFLTMSIIYAYIGFTYLFFTKIAPEISEFYFMYFLLSCIAIIYFFLNYKKILKPRKS
jgi:Predicted membrane protein (DUF2157)